MSKTTATWGASGTVTFDGTSATLFIENGDDIASAISKVFLLKPMGIDSTAVSGVANWGLSNNLDAPSNNGKPGTILSSYIDWEADDYFGAYANSASARIDEGNSATFTFTMASTTNSTNWAEYGSDQQPTIVIRWQEVGAGREGSSAGYGWLDSVGTVPPVPEPRLIGSLAALGLVGLLVIRRRFAGKAKKA